MDQTHTQRGQPNRKWSSPEQTEDGAASCEGDQGQTVAERIESLGHHVENQLGEGEREREMGERFIVNT